LNSIGVGILEEASRPRRNELRTSKLRAAAHIDKMAADHPFTIKIEPALLGVGRSRWMLYELGYTRDRSTVSYATRREAEADATKMMQKRIAAWRIAKHPSLNADKRLVGGIL
jgi:hypothetical protein